MKVKKHWSIYSLNEAECRPDKDQLMRYYEGFEDIEMEYLGIANLKDKVGIERAIKEAENRKEDLSVKEVLQTFGRITKQTGLPSFFPWLKSAKNSSNCLRDIAEWLKYEFTDAQNISRASAYHRIVKHHSFE